MDFPKEHDSSKDVGGSEWSENSSQDDGETAVEDVQTKSRFSVLSKVSNVQDQELDHYGLDISIKLEPKGNVETECRNNILMELFLSRPKSLQWYRFYQKYTIHIFIIAVFIWGLSLLLNQIAPHTYHLTTHLFVQSVSNLFFISFYPCLHIQLALEVIKSFEVMYLMILILVKVIVDNYIGYMDSEEEAHILAFLFFGYTQFLSLSLLFFMDAMPYTVFSITIRRRAWGLLFIVFIINFLRVSLVTDSPYSFVIWNKRWYVSDINASVQGSIVLFVGKLWIHFIFMPTEMMILKEPIGLKNTSI